MMLGVQNMSGLILEGDLGEEVDLWRLTSLSRWSKAKLKSPCYLEELSTAFVWLKVASIMINISSITVDCIPLPRTKLLFVLNEINVSLNRNGLLFKKITFKIRWVR
jgi:hypothetical protein